MSTTRVTQLDRRISLLSREEQLWLIERVIHRLRIPQTIDKRAQELHAMAHDPEIRKELDTIDLEFLETEMDGLS